jgi:hypothetical protein
MYHKIFPNSQKEVYSQNDNIDFQLGNIGRAVVPQTVKLTGEIRFLVDGARAAAGDDIKFDAKTGVHGVFDNFNTDFETSGNIENIQAYGRFIHMKTEANYRDVDAMTQVLEQVSLKTGNDDQTQYIAEGIRVDGIATDQSFSIMPDVVINNASSPLNYSKTGSIMMSFRTVPNNEFLFGTAVNMSYEIRNLQLHYETSQEHENKVALVKKVMLKNTINSSNQLLQNFVPLNLCEAVSMSFIETSHLSNTSYNQYKTELLPTVSDVEFNLNHNNAFISYTYDNPVEVQMNYLHSIANKVYNENTLDKLVKSVGYGVGHKLPSTDLSQRKLGVRIQSLVSNVAPYSVFSFFQGVIVI